MKKKHSLHNKGNFCGSQNCMFLFIDGFESKTKFGVCNHNHFKSSSDRNIIENTFNFFLKEIYEDLKNYTKKNKFCDYERCKDINETYPNVIVSSSKIKNASKSFCSLRCALQHFSILTIGAWKKFVKDSKNENTKNNVIEKEEEKKEDEKKN
jgi:hypothetical protein